MCTAVPLKQIRLKKSLRCQSLIRMHRFSWNTWIFMLKSSSPLIWFNWMPDTCISNDVKFRHSVKHDIRWFVSEWWKNQALNSFPNYPIRTNCNSEIFLRIVISKTEYSPCAEWKDRRSMLSSKYLVFSAIDLDLQASKQPEYPRKSK